MISFHTEPKWVPHLTYLKHTEKLYTRSEIRNCQLRRTTCIDIPLSIKVALSFKGLWVVDVHSLHQFRSWPFLKRGLTLMHFAAANKPCKPHRREKPKKKRSRQHSIFSFLAFFHARLFESSSFEFLSSLLSPSCSRGKEEEILQVNMKRPCFLPIS